MISRQSIRCTTCSTIHITRTGLGRSDRQVHHFPCTGCDQLIGFTLNLYPDKGSWEYVDWLDCEPTAEPIDHAPVVNLEADFLIPQSEQGRDNSFHRILQIQEMAEAREKDGDYVGSIVGGSHKGAAGGDVRGEWADLRRAWLLHRSGKNVLCRGKVKTASDKFYPTAPVKNLQEWIFRFNMIVGGKPADHALKTVADALKNVAPSPPFKELLNHYDDEMVQERGRIYFNVMNDFFNAYGDFGQIMPRYSAGLSIRDDLDVSSSQFERTKMFYGNAFESLGSLVDFVAFANNILQGRTWDKFNQLTVKEFLKLDKIARFNPFAGTAGLSLFANEADNQLRNASHHGYFDLDQVSKIITYRAGKGGQGTTHTITYVDYLKRCIALYTQVITLLHVELIVTRGRQHNPL